MKNWKTVGAIAPSSPGLARCIVKAAKIPQARTILELGTGTGAFTQHIHAAMQPGAQYLGLELNESFVHDLRIKYPALRFEAVAAQDCDFDPIIGSEGTFDAIISGLPWTAFPQGLQIAILDHVLPRLSPQGIFATFAYTGMHLLPGGQRFRRLLQSRCRELNMTATVWANLPPAFVYQAIPGDTSP